MTVKYGKNDTWKKARHAENHRLEENTKAKRILTSIVVTFAVSMLRINIFRLVALYWPGILSPNLFLGFVRFADNLQNSKFDC